MKRYPPISILILFVFLVFHTQAQEKINFASKDGLSVTADLYLNQKEKPYILMFHQAGYSRGEYKETARKFMKFGYNCLAVDLRSGGEVNYIQNLTALEAVQDGYNTDFISSMKDIQAAIDWAKKQTDKPIILMGSSFSASLCMVVAKNNQDIKAVIAFSPGEFFNSEMTVREEIEGLTKPVFVAATRKEYPYIKELLSLVPSSNKSIFAPNNNTGEHGSKSLWSANPNHKEYWLALTMFFSKIQ